MKFKGDAGNSAVEERRSESALSLYRTQRASHVQDFDEAVLPDPSQSQPFPE